MAKPKKRRRKPASNSGGTGKRTGDATGFSNENGAKSGTHTGDNTEGNTGETTNTIKRVGVLSMNDENNSVYVDEPQIAAQMDAVADSENDVALTMMTDGAGGEQPQQVESWDKFIQTSIRPILFGMVLPQWEVSADEQHEWSDALGQCCDQIFPGGPDGKYACWVRLILGSVVIAGTRIAMNGGKLPPLGPRKKEQPQQTNAVKSNAPATSDTTVNGGFTTSP